MLNRTSPEALIALMIVSVLTLVMSCASPQKRLSDEYYQKGYLFYANMEYEKSIDDLTRALDVNPKDKENYKVYFMRGKAYYKNRNYDLALEDFRKALEITPEKDKAVTFLILESRANTYYKLNKLDMAILDFSAALDLDLTPDPMTENIKHIYNNRAMAWYNKQAYEKAINDYTEVIVMDPDFAQSYYGRARAWFQAGNPQRAMDDIKDAIRRAPGNQVYEDFMFEIREQLKSNSQ